LGIVIGVAAVIAMLAVSEGASFEAQQQFRDLGASNILLKSVTSNVLLPVISGMYRI